MKNYLLIAVATVTLTSCFWQDDDNEECQVNLCEFYTKPDSIDFQVKVNLNDDNPYVVYEVYDGLYDEFNTANHILTDTAFSNTTYVYLPVGRHTFKAIYNRNGDEVWVFDSAKSKNKHYNCTPECWSTENGSVNVKLQ
ncbi:MAG: hypothetical protein ACPG4Z_05895 [Chitinophagales bacterium]